MRSRLGDRPFGIAPRVPNHLTLYELSALGPPDQAAARFEQWAEQIVADWSANRPPASRFGVTMPVLDETEIARPGPLFKVRRKLGIRSRLAHAGRYRSDYRNRLSAFQEAGCVILNPAGEFWISATDIPMRHLLDIYVAKKLGCLTAIVNHTFELVEPSLLQVVKHVYSAMDVISVREESSKARLTSLGIDPDLITVAPDVVFMTEPAPSDAHPASGRARVAICPNTAYLDQAEDVWSDLIQALLDREYDLTLVTNDFPTDRPALDRLRERFGLPQGGAEMPAKAYAGFLGTFDAVVSSRLHTGVLALTASTPVVPIEGLQFKITAAMTAAGVPLAAVRPGDPGWVDNVLRSLDSILADPAAARAWAGAAVRRQRESIDEFVDGVIHRLRLG